MTLSINGKEVKAKLLEDLLTTLKSLEGTIKEINRKNSVLTWVVIVLACLSVIASCIQIFFMIWPPSKIVIHPKQEIVSQKSMPELNKKIEKEFVPTSKSLK